MSAAAPPVHAGPGLVRAIGRWDLTAAVVNGVIGSAIFGMPGTQAALTGAWSPLAYLLAGLGVLTMVLCFAEVASRFDQAGGPYLYVREAFGRFLGFEAGWLTFWIRVTSVAANLNIFVEYLGVLAPDARAGLARAAVMTLVLGVVTALNVIGVRQAAWAVDLFTLAKLLPLALLVVLGLPRIGAETLASQQVPAPDWTQAILLLIFAYGGFEAPLIPAAEARDPRRHTAFALTFGLAVIASVYMLVQLVVVGVVPAVAGEKAPLAVAFALLIGPAGVLLASAGAMVSIWGWATGSVLQSPRLLYAMSERRELPASFARVHPRFRTPAAAILTYAGLSLAFSIWGSFEWNATLSAIVRLLTYGATCAALLVFRRRWPERAPGFRLPGAWLVAPLAVGFCLWLLSTRTFAQAWVLGATVAAGALLFAVSRRGD